MIGLERSTNDGVVERQRKSKHQSNGAQMAHDVLISYSTQDKAVADAVCATLEGRRIRCWIAPCDVPPGQTWAAAQIDSREMPLIPFRIEEVQPSQQSGGTPWSFEPMKAHGRRISQDPYFTLMAGADGVGYVQCGDGVLVVPLTEDGKVLLAVERSPAFDRSVLGLSAALALRQKVREAGIPVVVRMAHDAGLARLLGGEGGFENLHAFGLLDRTCTPEIVLGGTHERIARAIHEDYLRTEEAKGQTAGDNEALVPWEELSEAYKESNRRQADQMGQKLKAAGCGIAPLTDWQAADFCFREEQVEVMARMEHERWMAERLREGYRLGPRDREEKTNPNLVPWEQLSEGPQALTREMVRRIPVLLARVDLQVCRLGGTE